ncbi:MAG TPA: NADH-quinone oxidoreductase subunit C [Candidatus Methanoperedens sp.]|nr:NADH-quinone oxidoreductase subunit C [Candidatus Methanoperedens sp.]
MSDETTPAPAAPAPAPAPAPPPDPEAVAFAAAVSRTLGELAAPDALPGLPAWRVEAARIVEASRRLRDAGFDYLLFVSAVDRPAEGRFELLYAFTSYAGGRQGVLIAEVPRDAPAIDSVSGIFAGADWHERETYDLFGIVFRNHPFLRRILLDEDWPGHPLRKDYVDTLHDVVKRPY